MNQNIYNCCYEKSDLGDGLLPHMWGPPTWNSLHAITFGYPDNPSKEDMINYRTYFTMVAYVLPCKSCRESYADFIRNGDTQINDDIFKNRKSLTLWLYKLHNAVNKKLNVSYNLTYEKFVDTYELYRTKCTSNRECNIIKKYKFIR